MNKNEFVEYCKNNNIILNDKQIEQFELYKNLLIEWNKKFNLTTIIKEEDIYLKHFYDSILLSKYYDLNNKSICDIGTGAGFPGMVISILYPNSKITLIESSQKKVMFLNEVKKQLELNNVEIINTRAEDYGKNNREIYDIVTCRAVSALKIILELSISLLKINGIFIPMKSSVDEELNEAKNKISLLGYEQIKKYDYVLPIENAKRTIIVFKKNKKTDLKYPRNYNIIKKQ